MSYIVLVSEGYDIPEAYGPFRSEEDAELYGKSRFLGIEWNVIAFEPLEAIYELPGRMGGGEDATPHEWSFGHPWFGTKTECWRCTR